MVYVQLKTRKKDRNVFRLLHRNTHSCLGAHSSLLPLFWQHQKVIQNNSSPASAHFLSASYTRALLFTIHSCTSRPAHAEYPGYSIPNAGVSVPQKTQINAPPPPTHLAENISVDLCTTSRGAFNSCKMQMRSAAKIPPASSRTETEVLWKTFSCVSWNNLHLDCTSQGIHSMKGEELIKSSLLMLCSL